MISEPSAVAGSITREGLDFLRMLAALETPDHIESATWTVSATA